MSVSSPACWWRTEGLAGVRLVDRDGAAVILALDDGVNTDAVLDAARRAGRVETFDRVRSRLSDVFRSHTGHDVEEDG